MYRISIIGSLLLAAVCTLTLAQDPKPEKKQETKKTESFRIDPVHSMALFRVHHMGAGVFHGRFNDVTGSVEYGSKAKPPLKIEISIPVASVDTGSERLDRHLKSADFFDAETHANMTFASTKTKELRPGVYEVSGNLTIRGVTKPVTVEVEKTGMRDGRMGKRCGFETTFTIKRHDFGVDYGLDGGAVGPEVRITVAVEAGIPRQDRGEAGGGRGNRGGMRERLLSFDEDKDGKISKSEISKMPERMQGFIGRLDTNGDGVLDASEIEATPQRGGGRRPREGGGDRGGNPPRSR